ncbi:phospholipase D family protein [Pontiellaceae bacterium B12219]|nr:phospholipase D family protein [Pontiellaceae bacterium B12219]
MNAGMFKIGKWAGIGLIVAAVCIYAAIKIGFAPTYSTHKTVSTAFDAPESTALGQTALKIAADHDGQSGFLLLDRGRDAMSWRLILADAAQKSIDIQYFLWKNDAAGKVLMQRMLAAADRGVRVRILIDDSMTESDPQYLALLSAPENIEVRLYKPFGPKAKSMLRWVDYAAHMKVINHRMHNKLFLVDGSMEIIGGRNIGEEYFEYPGSYVFRSRDLLALGPVVNESGAAFDLYWNSDWAVPIEQVVLHLPTPEDAARNREALDAFAADPSSYPRGFYDNPKQIDAEMAQLSTQLYWGKGTLLIDDVPARKGRPQTHDELDRTGVTIERVAIQSSDELLVQSAYLILEKSSMDELQALTGRGVKVKLHTNSMAANNHLSAYVSYKKQRDGMLAGGAEVYEMRPDAKSEIALFEPDELETHNTSFGLHAKTMVFDRRNVFVGSFNLDPRSVDLNTEMGLLVESEGLGEAVAASIENDMAPGNSWRVQFDSSGKTKWVTLQDGSVIEEFEMEPMTTAKQRAEAEAMALIPDTGQM